MVTAERTARRRTLRKGYTTGACATAASKAAAIALTQSRSVEEVEITLPMGQAVSFKIEKCFLGDGWAQCSVIKDAGDDPDITHGAEIVATLSWTDEPFDVAQDKPGITIDRGEGVGLITKPGLGLPVGGPAINPVPRRMITEAVQAVLSDVLEKRGVKVVISVPGGEEMAKKTLNARLGIEGGISILGTTGIVVPYSTAAYRASITQALGVAVAAGCQHVVVTTGGRSERFAQRLLPHLPTEAFVEMGDFVGHSLRECVKKGVKRVTIGGMIGKLSKTAMGHMQTHAAGSQVDTAFLASIAKELGAPQEAVEGIRGNATARYFSEVVVELGLGEAFSRICYMVCENSRRYVKDALAIECIMTDFDEGKVLGRAVIE
ncbi:MAG: cobalamin biosynthesis protein CbiD [Dehalococcoidia bacterium]|nr:cobalamin biosynthesis protein CbiD [Dehalococcoidia bacterium]